MFIRLGWTYFEDLVFGRIGPIVTTRLPQAFTSKGSFEYYVNMFSDFGDTTLMRLRCKLDAI